MFVTSTTDFTNVLVPIVAPDALRYVIVYVPAANKIGTVALLFTLTATFGCSNKLVDNTVFASYEYRHPY